MIFNPNALLDPDPIVIDATDDEKSITPPKKNKESEVLKKYQKESSRKKREAEKNDEDSDPFTIKDDSVEINEPTPEMAIRSLKRLNNKNKPQNPLVDYLSGSDLESSPEVTHFVNKPKDDDEFFNKSTSKKRLTKKSNVKDSPTTKFERQALHTANKMKE